MSWDLIDTMDHGDGHGTRQRSDKDNCELHPPTVTFCEPCHLEKEMNITHPTLLFNRNISDGRTMISHLTTANIKPRSLM